MKDKKMFWADTALFGVAVIWGGGFIASKMALEGFSVMETLAWRFLGAALLIGIVFAKRIRKAAKKDLLCGALIGVMMFVGQTVQMIGLDYTTPGKQAFLVTVYVVLVPFVSWLILRKRPGIHSFIAGAMTLVGIALISLNESLTLSLGDGLSLGFAVIFSIQLVLTGIFASDVKDVFCMTFAQLLVSGLLSLAVTLFQGFSQGPHPAKAIGSILYLIVLNTFVGVTVQNTAQKFTIDTHASILVSPESVFGMLFSILVYHEIMTVQMLAGCIIIFAAVIISKLEKTSKSKASVPAI